VVHAHIGLDDLWTGYFIQLYGVGDVAHADDENSFLSSAAS